MNKQFNYNTLFLILFITSKAPSQRGICNVEVMHTSEFLLKSTKTALKFDWQLPMCLFAKPPLTTQVQAVPTTLVPVTPRCLAPFTVLNTFVMIYLLV